MGLALIDKPRGLTSFDVVARVRRTVGERRVGHAGTLDPMATGLLVVAVGEATKLMPLFEGDDKEYEATMRLGVETDTEDADGRVVAEREVPPVADDAIERTLARFVGPQEQRPPAYSALRHGGRRLYELARAGAQGVDEARVARPVVIHALAATAIALPDVTFRARVSKGTYIRSIARDVGRELGCGAHLTALRRVRSGPFTVDEAIALDRFQEAPLMIPIGEATRGRTIARVAPAEDIAARQGRAIRLSAPVAAPRGSMVALVCETGIVIGLGEIVAPFLAQPRRILKYHPSHDEC